MLPMWLSNSVSMPARMPWIDQADSRRLKTLPLVLAAAVFGFETVSALGPYWRKHKGRIQPILEDKQPMLARDFFVLRERFVLQSA